MPSAGTSTDRRQGSRTDRPSVACPSSTKLSVSTLAVPVAVNTNLCGWRAGAVDAASDAALDEVDVATEAGASSSDTSGGSPQPASSAASTIMPAVSGRAAGSIAPL
ncbi:hypothetical protein C1I99_01620 [Micromonospora deserti]|uniref:Uncharacterized protein n=1 Tax=Micromonospora deserti TaxID=2070366 RepID=A0A2W2CT79_9ACTN|nr:hypothetical protein C1I99_01620 [Micromonospora deserti]